MATLLGGRYGQAMEKGSAPNTTREWASFEDPEEERTWVFDVSFLGSNWSCIFGQGCQGVLTETSPELSHGCCSYGAHFTDKKDIRRVEKVAKTLSKDEWQFYAVGKEKGILKKHKDGETTTRVVEGACIFLNRVDFPTGPGCAFHQVAVARGETPMKLKPEVCWQLPLRREDEVTDSDGHVTSTIRQWDRRHWGEGGAEFAWWCTEAPEAFVGSRPVYRGMENELREMVGDGIFEMFAGFMDEREDLRGKKEHLPHPTVRSKTRVALGKKF